MTGANAEQIAASPEAVAARLAASRYLADDSLA
ncbi:MoxR family ATPase, partial [Mesorhizobium sp. M3A.F.Ca.ET.201.01.1.1]